MPIRVGSNLQSPSEESFKEVAYSITGLAFSLHNKYGSLFTENHYKHEMAWECSKLGYDRVATEVPIEVSYGDFSKQYFADLIVCGGALFELKVVAAVTNDHRAQTLNYLFLTGLQRAKLINFGVKSVQHEFVSTTLTSADRRQIAFHFDRWRDTNEESCEFRRVLIELLRDWGSFLQLPLFYEAIIHFFGGVEQVLQAVPVVRADVEVSRQRVHLLNVDTAFKLTAIGEELETMEGHIRRFLHHTTLQTIQWVNIHRHDVTFTTLTDGD